MNPWKVIQRQVYDILSHKLSVTVYICFFVSCLFLFLFYQIILANASAPQHLQFENIGGQELQNRLCYDKPIDAVITWVNGSDPLLQLQLEQYQRIYRKIASMKCPYSHCFPSHITAMSIVSLTELRDHYVPTTVNTTNNKSWSIISWASVELAAQMSNMGMRMKDTTLVLSHCHWTTDVNGPNLYLRNDTLFVQFLGLGPFTELKLRKWLGQQVKHVWFYKESAVVEFFSEKETNRMLQNAPWRIMKVNQGTRLNVTRAFLILELPTELHPTDYAPSRFDDKEELRYCLRSLEKYAPWLRHIYIVTNGQIPYWLNLENPRVSVITHEEIFTNSSHLPTFSSPAIETHIHRISGLSEQFLYINDDILLGQEIWPEDFFSLALGQKIYLSWPVPDCTPLCPWSWVNDGSCDAPCNNSLCGFDGDDCLPDRANSSSHEYEDSDVEGLVNAMEKAYEEEKAQARHHLPFNNSAVKANSSVINFRDYKKNRLNLGKAPMNISLLDRHIRALEEQRPNKLARRPKLMPSIGIYEKYYGFQQDLVNLNRNLDTFAKSLLYVNGLFNEVYEFKMRKVPAHMPHFIDKNVLQELHFKFRAEFSNTSSHRFRSSYDMQFAFSYYYFLMSEKILVTDSEIFDKFDTDGSGTWSDREIRTIVTQLYSLPLTFGSILHFEGLLQNCAKGQTINSVPPYERYLNSKLPLITKEMVLRCPSIMRPLIEKFGSKPRFRHTVLKTAATDSATGFHMVTTNISILINTLDVIRGNPKKFFCLNDNMDFGNKEEYNIARAVLLDFYHSLLPTPSQFELDPDYSNRFLYYTDLLRWQQRRIIIANFICCTLFILLMFITVYCFRSELEMIVGLNTRKRHRIFQVR